jgi:hypothetical protein
LAVELPKIRGANLKRFSKKKCFRWRLKADRKKKIFHWDPGTPAGRGFGVVRVKCRFLEQFLWLLFLCVIWD